MTKEQKQIQLLKEEIELKNQHIANLEALLREVTPLKRHLRKHIEQRLQTVDRKIRKRLTPSQRYKPQDIPQSDNLLAAAQAVDKINFAHYNQSRHASRVLKAYTRTGKMGKSIVHKALKLRRK